MTFRTLAIASALSAVLGLAHPGSLEAQQRRPRRSQDRGYQQGSRNGRDDRHYRHDRRRDHRRLPSCAAGQCGAVAGWWDTSCLF